MCNNFSAIDWSKGGPSRGLLDGWKHLQKIQMEVYNEIMEACLLHVIHEVWGEQVE